MTRIECSKCGEIIESTAATFVAPFVCNECLLPAETSRAIEDAVKRGYQMCLKAHNLGSLVIRHDLKTVNIEPETLPVIPCDTASVENTTLLIADLEEQ